MSDEIQKEEPTRGYQDFITFEPDAVKFLQKKEMDLVNEHNLIIKALRNKNMTVKEIHGLYYDLEKKENRYNIKTIYRHLDKLENAELVVVAGHRMTGDSRKTEKLYRRTAYVFFQKEEEEELNWWAGEEGKRYIHKLQILIQESLKIPKINVAEFYDFFRQYARFEDQIITELLEETKHNEVLADLYSQTELNRINKLNAQAGMLIIFLRNPEIYEKLKKLTKQ